MNQLVKAWVSTDFDIDITPSTDFIDGLPFIENAVNGITSSGWALGATALVAALIGGAVVWAFGKMTGGNNAREKGLSAIIYPVIGAVVLGAAVPIIAWALSIGFGSDGGDADSDDAVETSQIYLVPEDSGAIDVDSGFVVVVA